MAVLSSGSVILPAPISLSTEDEIIWSSNTGRMASGEMAGDIIAEKKTLNIKWGPLTEDDVAKIKTILKPGFHPITFRDDGAVLTISQYRGTLSKEHLGYIGDGIYWYKSVSVKLIQK